MKKLEIKISGPMGSGKSTVARIIKEALKKASIRVRFTEREIFDVPCDPELQEKRIEALRGVLEVEIDTHQTRNAP